MRRLIIYWFILGPIFAFGQHGLGMHFLPQTYQSTLTNPAFQQAAKVQVVQPLLGTSFTFEALHSGFTLRDAFVDLDDDPLQIDPDQLIDALRPNNYLVSNVTVMPLAVAFQFQDKWQFGIHAAVQTRNELTYSDGLPGLLWRGNGAYLDESVNLGLSFDAFAYSEVGLSASTAITDKVRVGGRLKLLHGLLNVSTDHRASDLSLYTNPEFYQLTLDYDYRLRFASAFDVEIDSLNDITNLELGEAGAGQAFNFSNPGVAIDLGVQFMPIEKLTVNASLVNFGSISWRNSASVFATEGSLTFEGLDPFSDEIDADSATIQQAVGQSLEAFLDSASAAIELGDSEADRYRTGLPARYFLSGTYDVTDFFRAGVALTGESYRGGFNQTLMLNATLRPVHWFTLGLNYAYDYRYRSMLGMQGRLNLKFLQFYAAAGNVLAPFQVGRLRAVSYQFGLNLTFGRQAAKKNKN